MIEIMITSDQDSPSLVAELYIHEDPIADITKSGTGGGFIITFNRYKNECLTIPVEDLLNAIKKACDSLK
jgi:hypothetical protein